MTDPWIVDIKGAALQRDWEISLVRSSNKHGQESCGWFDEDKILIGHDGGPCETPVLPRVWDLLIEMAHKVCAEINELEACGERVSGPEEGK
jgi:hypothetical protein